MKKIQVGIFIPINAELDKNITFDAIKKKALKKLKLNKNDVVFNITNFSREAKKNDYIYYYV